MKKGDAYGYIPRARVMVFWFGFTLSASVC